MEITMIDTLRVPPLGCDSIDDDLVVIDGVRILGLGGSPPEYRGGVFQYSEKQMEKRYKKLTKKIRKQAELISLFHIHLHLN